MRITPNFQRAQSLIRFSFGKFAGKPAQPAPQQAGPAQNLPTRKR